MHDKQITQYRKQHAINSTHYTTHGEQQTINSITAWCIKEKEKKGKLIDTTRHSLCCMYLFVLGVEGLLLIIATCENPDQPCRC